MSTDLSHDSYDSTPPRGSGPVWTRVYRPRGRVAHLREANCRHVMWSDAPPSSWLGTGGQDEYDQAAAMRLCLLCFARREARLPDRRLGAGHGTEMR